MYWLGDEFEGRPLTSVTAEDWSTAAVLVYGTCEPSGGFEPSCAPPVQVQVFPLCFHLDAVALPSQERRRRRDTAARRTRFAAASPSPPLT